MGSINFLALKKFFKIINSAKITILNFLTGKNQLILKSIWPPHNLITVYFSSILITFCPHF